MYGVTVKHNACMALHGIFLEVWKIPKTDALFFSCRTVFALWPEDAESFVVEFVVEEHKRGSRGILWCKKQRAMRSKFGLAYYNRRKLKQKFLELSNLARRFQYMFETTSFEWDPNTNTVTDRDGARKTYFQKFSPSSKGLKKERLADYFRVSQVLNSRKLKHRWNQC